MLTPQHHAALHQALRPVDGLRVIANILVSVLHHASLRESTGIKSFTKFCRETPGMLPFWNTTYHSLDLSFVLCGFLAFLSLVPLLSDPRRPVRQAVLLYYWRRAARIFPAHWASLAVTYVFVLRGRSAAAGVPNAVAALGHYHPDACPGGLWMEAAFLSNWQGMDRCGNQLWTQATMVTFWAALPLLLLAARPRRRGFGRRIIAGAGITVLLSAAYRAWVIRGLGISLPLELPLSPLERVPKIDQLMERLHMSLLCRAASLAMGGVLAVLLLEPASLQDGSIGSSSSGTKPATAAGKADEASTKETTDDSAAPQLSVMPQPLAWLGGGLALAVLHRYLTLQFVQSRGDGLSWGPAGSAQYLLLMGEGGILTSAAIATLMAAATTRAGPVGQPLHAVLGAPFWKPLALLSYSAYLYHEQARYWLWRYGVLPKQLAGSSDDLGALAIELAATQVATYAAAYASYVLVEKPAARAARRLEPLLFGGGSGGDGSGYGQLAEAGAAAAAVKGK